MTDTNFQKIGTVSPAIFLFDLTDTYCYSLKVFNLCLFGIACNFFLRLINMSEGNDDSKTPSVTPRMRLGMRRIISASVPKTVQSNLSKFETPIQSIQRRSHKLRLGNYSAPRTQESTEQTAKSSNDNDSTPNVRKRISSGTQGCAMVKKLRFTDSPNDQVPDTAAASSEGHQLFSDDDSMEEKVRKLKENNEAKRIELKSLQNHEQNIEELKMSTKQWRDAGIKALKQLKSKLDPPQSTTSILTYMHISLDLFDMEQFSDCDSEVDNK